MKTRNQKIENELWAAYNLIPKDVIQTPEGYEEEYFIKCMNKSEFLYAMEELDGVIEENNIPCKEFWLHLINASKLMKHIHLAKYKSMLKTVT